MPKFDDNDFEKSNNKYRDRTVPEDENYYGHNDLDLDMFSKGSGSDDIVRDNQRSQRAGREVRFQSEAFEDFDTGRERSRQSFAGRPKKNGNKQKRKSLKKKILGAVLAVILVLVGSVMPVLARVNYNEGRDNEYVNSSDLISSSMVKNVLLLGVDARSDEESNASRSDTMMLVSFDMKHRCVKITSFLRDSWVYIPSLGYEQRLNSACADGGYQNVVDTIEYNFGVDIDGYVVTDFEMFKVLVDSIGGVEVDVSKKEAREINKHPKRYGNVKIEAGKNKLTGEQALAYSRIRKIDTDFERTKRQRAVIKSILSEVKSNPFKLYRVAFNSAPYIETSLSKGEIMSLASRAALCLGGSIYQEKVPFDTTWSYATIQGNSVISIDTDSNKAMLIDFIYNLGKSDLEGTLDEE